jgi:hypothetical protein
MKFLSFLCLSAFCFMPSAFPDDVLTPQLFSLLELTGVEIQEQTLPSIVEATQKSWLRKDGIERWEISEFYTQNQQREIADLCDKMGFFQEVQPKERHYNYCCILGAALPTARARILYAKELWERGIRFDQIILLTGDRDLDDRIDKVPELEVYPHNEAAAIGLLYRILPLPDEMKDVPMTLIETPKIGSKRPSTSDTVAQWMNQNPQPGTCLFVSNQPWIKYQRAVVEPQMRKAISFEVVGPQASTSYRKRASVMLDNIARWLYAENECLLK